MQKLNRTAKQAFYVARKREGDLTKISTSTGYSVSHISNVLSGRRNVSQDLADGLYDISRRRQKNSEKTLA